MTRYMANIGMPRSYVLTPYVNDSSHESSGAMSIRCLTWIVETTASRARYCVPSRASTPTHRPSSSSSRSTWTLHSMRPPFASITRTSASVTRPDPPSGMVQLRR